ncbi:hypothetical protein ACI8AC_07820 [Geodermatophilus sp. SYSU D00758]
MEDASPWSRSFADGLRLRGYAVTVSGSLAGGLAAAIDDDADLLFVCRPPAPASGHRLSAELAEARSHGMRASVVLLGDPEAGRSDPGAGAVAPPRPRGAGQPAG